MRKLLLSVLLCFSLITVFAQDIVKPVPKAFNRELGLFGQTPLSGNDDQSLGLLGLQYKHWHSQHLGVRAIIAYGDYTSSTDERTTFSGDTIVTRQRHTDIALPVLGFGIEAQRHFYKRVHLFAALELKGGYGTGSERSWEQKSSGQGDSIVYQLGQNVDRRDASLTYIGMTASVGAKIQWARICLGMELFPISLSYRNMDRSAHSVGIADLNIGAFSQRLFLHYRF
jgi:hypothetical protein